MLKSLLIKNYILIDDIKIDFNNGLSIITGETGAGKSIIIGAISLITGQRADSNVIKDINNKCVVEGYFNIEDYSLKNFFDENDLDYSDELIIRREILENGKSRIFINDTPAKLSDLKTLGDMLIDIHSQHKTLTINKPYFQLSIIDSCIKNKKILSEYKFAYNNYIKSKKELDNLILIEKESIKELDYMKFQFDELEKANLLKDDFNELEKECNALENSEEIKSALINTENILNGNDSINILSFINDIKNQLDKVSVYSDNIKEIATRINSVNIELKDIYNEISGLQDKFEFSPAQLEYIQSRLNLIYNLEKKHNVNTVQELIKIKDDLDLKISNITSLEENIKKFEEALSKETILLEKLAKELTKERESVFGKLEKDIVEKLKKVGMPDSSFVIKNTISDDFNINGKDSIKFLFSSNKGIAVDEISKVASGGEMSRLMLVIKSVINEIEVSPIIIFDEIDNGVSGDIADKVGTIIKEMSNKMQIIAITHLPQIAAKADEHFSVYKSSKNNITSSVIKSLNNEEKITEIAKMLSGEKITEEALNNAKVLLKN